MRGEPFLWIHLAGLAAVPLLAVLCLLGLAVGDPVLPAFLEILLVGAVGIAPILWMQLSAPFCIFALLLVALEPEQLTEDQRRLLVWFRTPVNKGVAIALSILLFFFLWQLYRIAPIAADITPFRGLGHGGGLGLAAIAFMAINLFTQVPASVALVLRISEAKLAQTPPMSVEDVAASMTLLGVPVRQILPRWLTTAE